jgi:hypothetical protein
MGEKEETFPAPHAGVSTQNGGPHLLVLYFLNWNACGHVWQPLIIRIMDLGG